MYRFESKWFIGIRALIFSLVLWLLSYANAQTVSKNFLHLDTSDGLPQNLVDCIWQDSHGFMWFGTWNGICRYDGYDFDVFDGFELAISTNFIRDIGEDQFGNIWIATNQGLFAYHYANNTFHKYVGVIPESDQLMPDVRVITFSKESELIIGSDLGVSSFSVDSMANLTLIRHLPLRRNDDVFSGTQVTDVVQSVDQSLWVATDNGLYHVLKDDVTAFRYDSEDDQTLSSDQVMKVYETMSGEIWVGTEYGLNKYLKKHQKFRRFFHQEENPNSLPHHTVTDILEVKPQQLFIGTLGGIGVMNEATYDFTVYKNELNNDHSLSNDFVNCIYQDRDQNIWIGTDRGGINFYVVNQNRIEHYFQRTDDPKSLSASAVNSIFEDEDYIWIGTAGGGLDQYDKSTGQFTIYRNDHLSNQGLTGDFVSVIIKDDENRLWVATWGDGLHLMDQKNGVFQNFRADHGLISNYISSIEKDRRGNFYIGTINGISYFDPNTETFTSLFQEEPSALIDQVGCLMFDTKGDLWVGTRNGLFQVSPKGSDPSDFEIVKYEFGFDQPGSISGDYILSMLEDSKGQLWFGTYGHGLNRLMSAQDSVWFEHYGIQDGLGNTIVYALEEDDSGNLWMSTDYGLTRFDPENRKFRNYYAGDGFLNNQYYWSASYKNREGKLYFGGMEGMDAFFPKDINQQFDTHNVVITDLKLLSESVIPKQVYNGKEVLRQNVILADTAFLSYKERMFGLEFAALNYQDNEPIKYAYILEGFEKDWNYVSAERRYVSYTNLTPGTYTFKVKASDHDGIFDSPSRELVITIAPPFWETPLFRGLLLIALIAIVLAYIRFRTYTLKRQKIHLEKQVLERTEQINQQKEALSFQAIQLRNTNEKLEANQKLIAGQNEKLESQNKEILNQRDEVINLNEKLNLVSQLKLSFFTNISHEFRTPLTLIIGPLERLLKEYHLNSEVNSTLKVMQRNAHRLLYLINQIMDFRKIEKGRMELHAQKTDISRFTKDLFSAFQPLAEIKGIRFDYSEKNIPDTIWVDTQKLENILYNLLSNAFKYTPKGGRVELKMEGMGVADSRLNEFAGVEYPTSSIISFKICDSGIGISEENLPLIFKRFYRIESEEAFKISGSGVGLAITEELVKTHHGEIFVDSHPGQGSTFEVQIPGLNSNQEPKSTSQKSDEPTDILQQIEVLKNEFMTPETQHHAEEPMLDKEKATVLVVEDSHDLRNFITHRLRKRYNVIEAENGVVALQLAHQQSPDIVISDVMMPKMDGLELCANLKGNLVTSHVPLILLTSKSAVEDQLEGLQIGADDYLPKPFNFDLLEAKIQNFIESHQKLRQLFIQASELNIDEVTTNSKDQKFLEKAVEIVSQYMHDSSFGVKEFVEEMGISRSLLHKKLSSLTDQSAAEFINHLKMKKARQLLKENSMNISEVAYSVGYNDPKYFSRIFSKHFDQSPKAFVDSLKS